MLNLGTVRPGSTIYVPFNTYDSNAASVIVSAFTAADIEIYKDGSTTQRASDAGYTLLDTDGINFDAHVGIHGFSIDLADNTTAGFYAGGSRYFVVVGPITSDGQTVNFVAATFDIGYPNALINTTVDTYSSQTSFTLPAGEGPAEADALNGCPIVIHDVASAVQLQHGVILDYAVTTRTVTLDTDPGIFTFAATDNVAIFPPSGITAINGNKVLGAGTSGDKWRA